MVRFVALYQGEYDPERLVKRLQAIHPMTLVRDEKSLSGTVSYKYMMLILRTYNAPAAASICPSSSDLTSSCRSPFTSQKPSARAAFAYISKRGVDCHRICNKRLWFSPGRDLLCRP